MAKTRDDLVVSLIRYAGDDYTKDQASFVEDCVDGAIDEIVNRMCPWSISETKRNMLKEKALRLYSWNIRRIAEFHYDKQGKGGVTTFYESGQTTSYESGGTPSEYLDSIVPMARVI